MAPADEGSGEGDERLVDVGPSFVADRQAAEAAEPGERALHDPAVPAQALAAFHPASGDPALEDHGISGAAVNRPALGRALAALREGDVLVVWKLDRLGRCLPHLIEGITGLRKAGIGFCSLQEQIDTTSAGGRFYLHILAALAEFERELNSERTRAGMKAARRRGIHLGRAPKLERHQVEHARELIAGGKTRGEIAALLGASPKTLWRALRASKIDFGQ